MRARGREKLNAVRGALVVIGSLAFGYLTLQLGFKPYLLKAQELEQSQSSSSSQQQQDSDHN